MAGALSWGGARCGRREPARRRIVFCGEVSMTKRWEHGSPDHEEATVTEERPRTQTPRRYRVLLHNDDFTSMEFVVAVLVRYFSKNEAEASHIMFQVHLTGIGVAGVYTRDQAETKVAQVTAAAEAEGFPLLVTMEPE
jgi:ATP-dependent Clp protease adaptor protein ClpS